MLKEAKNGDTHLDIPEHPDVPGLSPTDILATFLGGPSSSSSSSSSSEAKAHSLRGEMHSCGSKKEGALLNFLGGGTVGSGIGTSRNSSSWHSSSSSSSGGCPFFEFLFPFLLDLAGFFSLKEAPKKVLTCSRFMTSDEVT